MKRLALCSMGIMAVVGATRLAHAQTDDWSAYRGSGTRTAASTGPSLAGGEAYWQVDLAEPQLFYYFTAVAGGTVYALGVSAIDGELRLATFDAEGGTPGWTGALGYTDPLGLAIGDGLVVVTSRDTFTGHVLYHAVDRNTGAVAWSHDLGPGLVSPPAIDGTRVFGSINEGAGMRRLVALELASGDLAFTADVALDFTRSAIAVAGGLVYVAGTDNAVAGGQGYVRAYDAADGALAWEATGAAAAGYSGTPIVAGGRVYAGNDSGAVHAFDAATGVQVWERAGDGDAVARDMVYANDTLYFFDASFDLVAVDGATGAERWSTIWPIELQQSGVATILASGDELYLTDAMNLGDCSGNTDLSGELVALDGATGAKLSTSRVGAAFNPSVSGGRIYATTVATSGGVGSVQLTALGKGDDTVACEADLAAAQAASAACEADLVAAEAALAVSTGDLATCTGDLATCAADLAGGEASLAACESANATLGAQLAACTANLEACQAGGGAGAELTARLDQVRDFLREEMNDPTFELPGATPEAKLDALVGAITALNHGHALHLYTNLGGREHP